MSVYDKILDEVKKSIRPDKLILEDVDNIVLDINESLSKNKIDAECSPGGSIAKGTFLKNDYDIDLFIRFNQMYKNKDISGISEKILKPICKRLKKPLERIHGSRDYFQFHIKKNGKVLDFEIIPVIYARTAEEAVNITDLSPEHVLWVKKKTANNEKLLDDIRLAKQFCKANKVYGAESYINGFSGHILDILIIYYGSFVKLLEEFSEKKPSIDHPIIIDSEKKSKNPLKDLNKSKISPLIIIDPVQDDRNSAAALSEEKLLMFIDSAKKFLRNPSKTFFEIEKFNLDKKVKESIKKINSINTSTALIDITANDGSKDIMGTKILKVYEAMCSHLEYNDFKVLDSGWNFDYEKKSGIIYMIIDNEISKEIIRDGPPLSIKEDYEKFLEKHKKLNHRTMIKGQRVYAVMPRIFTDPKNFLIDLSKKGFIKDKVKSIKIR